jgi:hypothetical protein
MVLTKQLLRHRVTHVAVVLVFLLSASASGFLRAPGSGSATGSAATPVAVTIAPGSAGAGLYPGGQADVSLTVDNPNAFSLHIGSLSLATGQGAAGFGVDAGHAACATSTLGFTTQTNGGAGWSVPAKVGSTNGTVSVTLPNALAMSASAANACQGATFDVYLSAGP